MSIKAMQEKIEYLETINKIQETELYVCEIERQDLVATINDFELMVNQLGESLTATAFHLSNDKLTGIKNREGFVDILTHDMRLAHRDQNPLVIFFIDLNKFKTINDNLGHAVGDTVLKKFAEILKKHTRESDTCARLSGDEFAVSLPKCPLSQAEKIALAIKRDAQKLAIEIGVSGFGVSIGIVKYDMKEFLEEFLHRADVAMYANKPTGGGRE